MKFQLYDLLAPHYCCSCGEIGAVLCNSCFYDIIIDAELAGLCVVCLRLCGEDTICDRCRDDMPYRRAWIAAVRRGALKRLVDMSKFDASRIACDRQADILHAMVPTLPPNTIIVSVPTIRAHIRRRGYGHVERIARRFAKLRRLQYSPMLRRRENFVQRGADVHTRASQAKRSFEADIAYYSSPVMLIDDVFTTGSTVRYAAQTLCDAGVGEVWVAVTSRQPLDE